MRDNSVVHWGIANSDDETPWVMSLSVVPLNSQTANQWLTNQNSSRSSLALELVQPFSMNTITGMIVHDPMVERGDVFIAVFPYGNSMIELTLDSENNALDTLKQILGTFVGVGTGD